VASCSRCGRPPFRRGNWGLEFRGSFLDTRFFRGAPEFSVIVDTLSNDKSTPGTISSLNNAEDVMLILM